ncbi:MAG: hypothetical protein FJW35_07620 [Acidobacteria bacterium]|nr:hypothetical protein [Acidobacteriota bacterium]
MAGHPEQVCRQEITRRDILGGLAAAALLAPWGCSRGRRGEASCVAGKRIRWLVPFAAGGGYDIYSRLLEPHLQKKLRAEIVLENMPGAGGIIAATTLMRSRPDGLTLGILNAPGLLVAAMTGETPAPNPATDFTVLGRIVRNHVTWFTGGHSALRSCDDVLAEAAARPMVFGISEVGSTNFINAAVAAFLLGIRAEFIAGYPGSRETSLAVMRGEVDLAAFTFESVQDRVDARDLRPILQISTTGVSAHSCLQGVPLLGGPEGLAVRRAIELRRDPRHAEEDADALIGLTRTGILVAAPPGLEDVLFRCLEESLHETLADPAFQAAAARARRSLDIGRADEAETDLRAAEGAAARFVPVIRDVMSRMRR